MQYNHNEIMKVIANKYGVFFDIFKFYFYTTSVIEIIIRYNILKLSRL